jgi:phosphate starvation-inducible PhoH-like protein
MSRGKPKNPIHYEIELNEEQKLAKQVIMDNVITVVKGGAGSGKSLVATYTALDLLFTKEVTKIVITRPTVTAGEEIGFMPGNIDSKLAPYMAPLLDCAYTIYGKQKIDNLIEQGQLEVIPVAFMRGRNIKDCILLVDEGQNLTQKQMELLLGRLCIGSKMIITGDIRQCDLKKSEYSGFDFICNKLAHIDGFEVVTLNQNHRHPIIEQILDVYENEK